MGTRSQFQLPGNALGIITTAFEIRPCAGERLKRLQLEHLNFEERHNVVPGSVSKNCSFSSPNVAKIEIHARPTISEDMGSDCYFLVTSTPMSLWLRLAFFLFCLRHFENL